MLVAPQVEYFKNYANATETFSEHLVNFQCSNNEKYNKVMPHNRDSEIVYFQILAHNNKVNDQCKDFPTNFLLTNFTICKQFLQVFVRLARIYAETVNLR